ncbi:hypothetical protein Ahy_B01g052699 [Arachis hypogaea]|uniref:GRF-type domain-containing protein n=1 Tax=Arachis hypogaea TaxID=3818 RepID=A0A445AQ73_ARAHY|nr:hypothetical protein Ahy_B01g052699 [Arachis hypogaea]
MVRDLNNPPLLTSWRENSMASQSSLSSRSRSSSHSRLLFCSHSERLVLRTSGTKENPGRRFWDCVQQGCNFFHWTDPETEVKYSEVARIRRKVSSLKSRTKVAEWKLKVVAVLGKATVYNSIEPCLKSVLEYALVVVVVGPKSFQVKPLEFDATNSMHTRYATHLSPST